MNTKQRIIARGLLAGFIGAGLTGCVAFPVGKEDFTTEFATDVRDASDAPSKEYKPSVTLLKNEYGGESPGGGAAKFIGISTHGGNEPYDIAALRNGVAIHEGSAPQSGADPRIGIAIGYSIAASQPRARHYSSVTVTKRKMFAIGIRPDCAETFYHPQDALVPVKLTYVGKGEYRSATAVGSEEVGYGYGFAASLNALSLTLVAAPFQFLAGLFGPFESGRHFLGKQLDKATSVAGNGYSTTRQVHDSRDLDLLEKFPAADRRRIGAWTWRENDEHPQNTFWNGLTSGTIVPWPGVWKYCTYVVHEPVELERTTSEPPKRTVSSGILQGPYRVFLEIPDAGFARGLAVPRGKSIAYFDLSSVADGRTGVSVKVRILPPSGGLEEAWDDDARTMLEMLEGRVIRGTLDLPVPRLSSVPDGEDGR